MASVVWLGGFTECHGAKNACGPPQVKLKNKCLDFNQNRRGQKAPELAKTEMC